MRLTADRFVVHEDGRAVDLATGMRVVLITSRAPAPADQRAWSSRCDRFQRLHHHAIAALFDYGLCGRDERFEAWQCGPAWNGAVDPARRIRRSVAEFLHHVDGAADPVTAVHVRRGVPVAIPSTAIDLRQPPADERARALPIADRGLQTIQQPAMSALAEMFRDLSCPRPHAAALWGPAGSGKTTIVHELARMARVSGFIPIAARLIDSGYRDLWRGRSIFVIDDGDGGGWQALLRAVLGSAVPHAVLVVGESEVRGVDGLALRRMETETLIDSMVPKPMTVEIEERVRRAAEQSRGWPGRFVHHLWSPAGDVMASRPAHVALSRVAEESAVYGGDERVEPPVVPSETAAWPAPGELASLRRRMTEAIADFGRGRDARGVRHLRQAIGGLARRDCWTDAGEGALVLASALLRRGRVRDAQKVLADATTYAGRSSRPSMMLDATILTGDAWTDAARLDEAEGVLAAAVTSAAAGGDAHRGAIANGALARCLFWRGRYEEARTTLGRAADDMSPDLSMRRSCLAARIAIATGDAAAALSTVAQLLESGAPHALETAAFVHLVAGDAAAALDRAEAAIAAARTHRDPLCAVRARVILADAERRRGRFAVAAAHLRHLKRLTTTLPPLVSAHVQLALTLVTEPDADRDTIAKQVARSGVPALALLVEKASSRERRAAEPVVENVIAIVRACQTADDELVVLKEVCGRVREQLHAAAVSFAVDRAGRADQLVSAGARCDLRIGHRAMTAGVVIEPHRQDDRIEAAAPVQYGGSSIGALCVRWTLGSTYDRANAAALMAATAAAAAPVVSAALARRSAADAAPGPELIGVTPAMEQVRRLVDRAAAAPFPVLIEGESGSGKELVARAIHRASLRRDRVCRTLNCAALPDDLVETELFGHVRGSFTGAVGDRTGVFEDAHGGTLFLDEVGELSARAQAKLLRVIQEGEIRRVGENLSRHVDVRIVAATNRDLHAEAQAGRFRLDLLYRLDVIRITVPSLRDRADDVPLLVDHFWREATTRIGSRATLATSTVGALARYRWPGNVRELQNVLAALAVRCPKRGLVPASALPPQFTSEGRTDLWRLEDARRTFEESFVRAALVRSGGHRARAAAELGVSRQGLTKLMTRLGIS
jgi:DNA-binding NtrC family response regulator/tetratricopeptide (TPR) repeat protein